MCVVRVSVCACVYPGVIPDHLLEVVEVQLILQQYANGANHRNGAYE